MKFSPEGEILLRSFEGCKLTAYRDSAGILTIGYGHTQNVIEGMAIGESEAEHYLASDIQATCAAVEKIISPLANDNQFSAAVCFAFNVRNWSSVPLFHHLANGDFVEASKHWLLYDKVTINGVKVEVAGLKNRRQAELNLFLKPVGV